MIETFTMPFPRVSSKKQRKVYVYVPDGFEADTLFPVLYMFDGHNVFFDEDATYGKSWGMKEYLESDGTPLVVVAIDCDHRPNHGRLKEYCPFTFEAPELGTIRGRGKSFMKWMIEQLKPLIDSRFPVLSDREHTFIAGSSMGGLMTLYALTDFGQYFSRGAALSPSVWTRPDAVLHLIHRSHTLENSILYMDYGSQELERHTGMQDSLFDCAHALLRMGVHLTFRIVPGGEHCEACWEEQIPFFMHVLLYDGFIRP